MRAGVPSEPSLTMLMVSHPAVRKLRPIHTSPQRLSPGSPASRCRSAAAIEQPYGSNPSDGRESSMMNFTREFASSQSLTRPPVEGPVINSLASFTCQAAAKPGPGSACPPSGSPPSVCGSGPADLWQARQSASSAGQRRRIPPMLSEGQRSHPVTPRTLLLLGLLGCTDPRLGEFALPKRLDDLRGRLLPFVEGHPIAEARAFLQAHGFECEPPLPSATDAHAHVCHAAAAPADAGWRNLTVAFFGRNGR